MKRIWIGVGILMGLLAVGLLSMKITDRQVEAVSDALELASGSRDWEQAVGLAEQARKDWKQKQNLMGALTDHANLDEIEEGFAQLEVYRRCRAETDHAATCAKLAKALRDLGESHKLTWWNLL